jgi:Uma2 family endonuclease
MPASRTWTDEELMALPEGKHELVGGEIVSMNAAGGPHGIVVMRLGARLQLHVEAQRSGWLFDSSTGFWMPSGSLRSPDLAFVSLSRLPVIVPGFVRVVPDLAVEVRSPSDSPAHVTAKIREYLDAGVRLTWVIDPETRSAEIHRPAMPIERVGERGALDGRDVLMGFRCGLGEALGDVPGEPGEVPGEAPGQAAGQAPGSDDQSI